MADRYCRDLIKVSTSQICVQQGFDNISANALDTFVDVAIRYIHEVGSTAHRYTELASRTEGNIYDVLAALQDMNLNTDAMLSYGTETDIPFAHTVPRFPLRKPKRQSNDIISRPQEPPAATEGDETQTKKPKLNCIPPYLPAFPDEHTYKRTAVMMERPKDSKLIHRKKVEEKRAVENHLTKLASIASGTATSSSSGTSSSHWGSELN
eukprot:GILK01014926.1.p1 GENE.GILK01014926.1~~GILK01014926.1.p1  ORF type:complete len:218 (-),score=17.41 GILK01014926.1:93-719(-)